MTLARLWKVPIDPCNVQLGMAGGAIVLALQPLPWPVTTVLVVALVAGGFWWGQVYEKQAHGDRPPMDDPRTGIEFDNYRDAAIGVLFVVLLVTIRILVGRLFAQAGPDYEVLLPALTGLAGATNE